MHINMPLQTILASVFNGWFIVGQLSSAIPIYNEALSPTLSSLRMLLSSVSSTQHCRNLKQTLRGMYIYSIQEWLLDLTRLYVAMVSEQ